MRQDYYFTKLLSEWIQFKILPNTQTSEKKQNTQIKLPIPTTLVELQNQLEKNKEEIYISLPITQQEDITPTLTTLREYFTIQNIPEYLLNLPPLPEPTWEIFDLSHDC